MSDSNLETLSLPAPEIVEYDVIVSQHGVPQNTVRVSVDAGADCMQVARGMVASDYEGEDYTFDVVEPCDEDGLALAVRSMMALSPGFAEHVRGVA